MVIRRIGFGSYVFILFVVSQMFPSVANAVSADDGIAVCEKINNKIKRGECFESIAKKSSKKKSNEDSIDAFVSKAKKRVEESFSDPESAKYRNLFVTENLTSEMPSRTLCGEVNGKNRYGGYVGYKRFVMNLNLNDGKTITQQEGSFVSPGTKDIENSIFDSLWQFRCVSPKPVWQQ